MSDQDRSAFDSPAFQEKLRRQQLQWSNPNRRPAADLTTPTRVVKLQSRPVVSTPRKPVESALQSQLEPGLPSNASQPLTTVKKKQRNPKSQKMTLLVMAAIVFIFGVGASIDTVRTNRKAATQVEAL